MTRWNEKRLIDAGYEINNCQIKDVDLSMADHAVLTLNMSIEGAGWGCVYGGYSLAHGFLGADYDFFDGSSEGMESIVRIMDTVGVSSFNDMKGKYIRVATKGWGEYVKIIGNVIDDHWFDIESFFADKKEK